MNKDEYENNLTTRLLDLMKRHGLEKYAYSVLLIGSMGRGEATYEYTGQNGIALKSDVEVGVVFKSRRAVAEMAAAAAEELDEAITLVPLTRRRMTRLDNFNYAFLPSKRKTLMMYDIVHGGKTIWGRDYLKNAVLDVGCIDPYEAKRIVANRIGELVYTRLHNPSDVKRWRAKVVSAIGTAYLICDGRYKCGYAMQLCELKGTAELGADFVDCYCRAYDCLRRGKGEFDADDGEIRRYTERINSVFEAKRIEKPKVNTLSRRVKYAWKCLKSRKSPVAVHRLEIHIIDSLIRQFISGDGNIVKTAEIWHDVLY